MVTWFGIVCAGWLQSRSNAMIVTYLSMGRVCLWWREPVPGDIIRRTRISPWQSFPADSIWWPSFPFNLNFPFEHFFSCCRMMMIFGEHCHWSKMIARAPARFLYLFGCGRLIWILMLWIRRNASHFIYDFLFEYFHLDLNFNFSQIYCNRFFIKYYLLGGFLSN